MNHLQSIYLIFYILFIFNIFTVNRKSKYFYNIFSTILTKNKLNMYIVYTLIISFLSLYILSLPSITSKKGRGEMVVIIFLFILYFPLYFIKEKMVITYSTKESQIYRKNLDSINTDNKTSIQITEMPIYCDERKTKIGKFYSSANLISKKDGNTRVIQNIVYSFDGSHPSYPKGIINMNISFENEINNIFPPNGIYRGHILSGSEEYTDVTGHIDINVKDDMRVATFYLF